MALTIRRYTVPLIDGSAPYCTTGGSDGDEAEVFNK